MSNARYESSTDLSVPVEAAFAYHDRPGALDRLVPPWESVEIEHSDQSLAVGSRVVLKASLAGIPVRWHARHVAYDPPHRFEDVQDSGPFAAWHHTHLFEAAGEDSRLTDRVDYRLPGGVVGRTLGAGIAEGKLRQMFAFRHRITRDDLALMSRYPAKPMTVAISGQTGLVGSHLSSLLTTAGHSVRRIVRGDTAGDGEIAPWGSADQPSDWRGVDAVVHLAGKSIASGRWSEDVRRQIRESRVVKTRQLCETLAGLDHKPAVLICASATGIYGDRGEQLLDETSSPCDDFLADVAREWEAACQPAVDVGIRVVNARFGLILSPRGGALAKSIGPAKLFGGRLGSGRQWWSWIGIEDVAGAIVHAMHTDSLSGPVNFVTPQPVRNAEFAATLAGVLGRAALVPAPAMALRLALGEMADALLLSSTRVEPTRLVQSGYQYRFTELEKYLRYCLGRVREAPGRA